MIQVDKYCCIFAVVKHSQIMNKQKTFLFKDLTGRGITSKLPATHIIANWDLEEQDDNDITLRDFIETSDLGDTWITNNWQLTNI